MTQPAGDQIAMAAIDAHYEAIDRGLWPSQAALATTRAVLQELIRETVTDLGDTRNDQARAALVRQRLWLQVKLDAIPDRLAA